MANTIDDGQTLGQLFDKALALHGELSSDSSSDQNGKDFQDKVRRCILMLEDATRLTSALDVFSANENVEEVATEHLKFMLLPALLGSTQGLLREETDRAEVIKVQEAYYRDFLQRCRDYEVDDFKMPKMTEVEEERRPSSRPQGPPDMAKMNAERDAKLRRYKARKELEERLKALEASGDDDNRREFRLETIKRWVLVCLDELAMLESEKPLLAHMAAMRARGTIQQQPARPPPRPLKPIIITRDAAQKEVFGVGYKHLPILSIEEFYMQRVRDGWFPAPGEAKGPRSLQDIAKDEEAAKRQDEEEQRAKEKREEEDDEEELVRKRNMDEYKDWHKRGEGNRHNMG